MIGKLAFDVAMAHRIADREKAAARALGHDILDEVLLCWRAFDDVLNIAGAPDKPAVWPRGGEPR
jgi:hypothetical protein